MRHKTLPITSLIISIAALIVALLLWLLPASSEDPTLSQITFDACGTASQYRQESWFEDFSSAFAGPAGQPAISASLGAGLSGVCYSQNGGIVLALVPATYGSPSDVYKYTVSTGQIEKATFDSDGQAFNASSSEFGAREGNVIHLAPAVSGDAGECSTFSYDYNFVTNIISFVSQRAGC